MKGFYHSGPLLVIWAVCGTNDLDISALYFIFEGYHKQNTQLQGLTMYFSSCEDFQTNKTAAESETTLRVSCLNLSPFQWGHVKCPSLRRVAVDT